ncbi:APC amino acid permease [Coniophora puteana RWD-64-598 SS2]|uniref:APC amino acid permease n=1 Tax=Coniophora puteana (strain RWD-64-598) TaxID=741705 RepID=A0A5M3M9S0_CONPW|nr:APC amino acid permease [Coniophora puteana RWD-64-598 SS2]EIW75540.1 APC amino acid permease [Coniophora puteana RWD-64-598 SS2]
MIESPPTQIGFPSRNVQEADEALLARIGYKQELKREFSPFEIFAVCLMSMGLVPSIASVLFNSIPNGGPVAMIWGWIAAFPFILCIALGVAELASANPTSGGLYYWTHALSPPGCKNFMSWIVGYANTIANSIAMASVDWAFSLQLTAAVSMATDGAFVATQPQNFGIFIATLLLHGMVCTLCTKVLARLQNFCVLLEIFLSIVVIAVLPAVTPTELKNVPSYAFGEWTNLSGWPSGFAFFLSFLAPLWTVSGYDSSVHMSEEASNAAIAVPWATMGSVTLGFILGLALNISIAFCMGPDPTNIIDSPLGQPMAQIFYASLGKNAALALWSLVIAVQFFVGSSYLLVVSRQVFAFARDGALPFSRYVYSLGYGRRTPVFAVWMVVVFAMLTGLLSFAGAQAINAVFGMATAAGYVAYIGPMSARVLAARKSADETSRFRPGPFHLGSWSVPVLSVALAFMVFMIIIFLFPASPNINAGEMNYAVVVLGGTFTLVVVGYYFPVYGGVHWFRGPVSNIGVDGEADSGGNVGDFKDKGSETFRTVNA